MKKPKHMTPTQLKTIVDMTKDGVNPYRISKKMNVPASVVRYHVRKYKQTLPTKPFEFTQTPSYLDAFNEFKLENESLKRKNKALLEIVITQLQ